MRSFPDRPVVGVGAVILDGDRVVLVRRGHPPLKGEWSLPGGALELAETLEDAVVREIEEETGLAVVVGPVVEVVDRIHLAPDGRVEYHYVVIDYLCRCLDASALRPGTDASEARWVAVSEVDAFRVTPPAGDVIRKAAALRESA